MSVVFKAPVGASGSGATGVERSVRLRAAATAYFERTFGTPTNNTSWACSCFLKRGGLSTYQIVLYAGTTSDAAFRLNTSYQLELLNNGGTVVATSAAVFRDSSAFGHLFIRSNGTNIKAFWNGSEVLSYTGTVTNFNSAIRHRIGYYSTITPFDGYMTEWYWVDGGGGLTYTDFTAVSNNILVPKAYTGSYGSNGFYLNFRDASAATAAAIGKDSSGNGNNWTPNNISLTAGVTYDSMYDYPVNAASGTQPVGNYATFSPINISGHVLSNGNLDVALSATAQGSRTTFPLPRSGKWYWEVTVKSTNVYDAYGIVPGTTSLTADLGVAGNFGIIYSNTAFYNNGTSVATGKPSFVNNDVLGFEVDIDGGTITFYRNGTSLGAVSTTLTGKDWYPCVGNENNGSSSHAFNFGQRPFSRTPSTGFKALCTANLPSDSVVTSGSFTGNAAADGPVVYLKGNPTALTINGNAVTFGTHADKLATGFKLRTSSASYNASGTNNFTATAGDKFANNNRAQGNP